MSVNAVGSGAATINTGQASNATVSTGGADTLVVGKGSVNADLGSGNNVVQTSAPTTQSGQSGFVPSNSHDGYTLSVDGNNRIVLDDGQGHVSTLANVNVVQFSNGSTFVKASTADEAIIARMYEAVLDRTADSAGIYNWWDAYNSGQLSLQQVGTSFLNSTEAQLKGFGPNIDNATFVTNLYHNLLERDPDQAGLLNWTNALNNGALSRADVLLSFTASVEGAATNAGSVLLSTVSGQARTTRPTPSMSFRTVRRRYRVARASTSSTSPEASPASPRRSTSTRSRCSTPRPTRRRPSTMPSTSSSAMVA